MPSRPRRSPRAFALLCAVIAVVVQTGCDRNGAKPDSSSTTRDSAATATGAPAIPDSVQARRKLFTPLDSSARAARADGDSPLHHDGQRMLDCDDGPCNDGEYGPFLELISVRGFTNGIFDGCKPEKLQHGCVAAIIQVPPMYPKVQNYSKLHLRSGRAHQLWVKRPAGGTFSAAIDRPPGTGSPLHVDTLDRPGPFPSTAQWYTDAATGKVGIGVKCVEGPAAAERWCVISPEGDPFPLDKVFDCPASLSSPVPGNCSVPGAYDAQQLSTFATPKKPSRSRGWIVADDDLGTHNRLTDLKDGVRVAFVAVSFKYQLSARCTLAANTKYELFLQFTGAETEGKDPTKWNVRIARNGVTVPGCERRGSGVEYEVHEFTNVNGVKVKEIPPVVARWKVNPVDEGLWTKCGPGCCQATLE